MTYSKKHREWLTNVSSVVIPASEDMKKSFEDKARGQALIAEKLGPQSRASIGAAFESVTLNLETKGLEGAVRSLFNQPKTIDLMDKNHDPMAELDTWNDMPSVSEVDPIDLQILTANYRKIMELAADLRSNDYYKEPKKPDVPPEPSTAKQRKEYADAKAAYNELLRIAQRRLAEDLFKPLEREGVLPENFIPDAYSEVTRQFVEANALYEDRLQEYSKELGDHGAFMEKFSVGMEIGQGLLSVAMSANTLAGSVAALAENKDVIKDVAEAKKVLDWVKVGMTSFDGVTKGVLKERDGIAVADALNGALSAVLKSVLPEAAATIVNGAIEASIRSSDVGKRFAQGDIEGGLNALGATIASYISAVDTSEDKNATAIGSAIATGLSTLATSSSIRAKVKDGDVMGALSDVIGGIDAIANEAEAPAKKWRAQINAAAIAMGQDINDIATQNKILNSQFDQAALDARAEKAAKLQNENLEEFMRQQDRGFEEALAFGFAEPNGDTEDMVQAEAKRLKSLEYIVAAHRRNEMMFELSKKILVGGPGLITKLVPGMSLVAAATQLTYSIAEALKCAQQMLIWCDNLQDAQKASTAQVDAILNRYGLQQKQTIMANIKVATQAIIVAGEAMKLAGQAAPAGAVVAASAAAAESLIEVAAKVVEVAEMQSAWADYKQALATPQNRKALRKAMRSNPTLSKYAMAWGAVEDGNPIAQEVMKRCGLNEQTLAQSDLQVGAVVDYLEMIYKDDPVLLRAVPVDEPWHPGDIEFNLQSWLRFYQAATKRKTGPLADFDMSSVNGALSKYETGMKAFEADLEATLQANVVITQENAEVDAKARTDFRALMAEYLELDDDAKASTEAPAWDAPVQKPLVEPSPAIMEAALNAATEAMIALGRIRPKIQETDDLDKSFATYADAMAAKAEMARTSVDSVWDAKAWMM